METLQWKLFSCTFHPKLSIECPPQKTLRCSQNSLKMHTHLWSVADDRRASTWRSRCYRWTDSSSLDERYASHSRAAAPRSACTAAPGRSVEWSDPQSRTRSVHCTHSSRSLAAVQRRCSSCPPTICHRMIIGVISALFECGHWLCPWYC